MRSQDRPGPSGASEESGPELRLAAWRAGAFIVRDAGRAEIIHGVQRGVGRCKPLGGSCQWVLKLKTCRDHQQTAVLRDNGRGRAHATRAAPIRPGLAGACVHQTNERVARRHLARNGAVSSLAPPILIQAWHRAIHTDLQHLRLGCAGSSYSTSALAFPTRVVHWDSRYPSFTLSPLPRSNCPPRS